MTNPFYKGKTPQVHKKVNRVDPINPDGVVDLRHAGEAEEIPFWDNCPLCRWYYKQSKLDDCPMCRHPWRKPVPFDQPEYEGPNL